MAEGPDREGCAQPGNGEWPAWLDEDDFDGLGEDGWRAAMESLAEEGPEPECPPDASVPDGGLAAAAPAGGGREGGLPDDALPDGDDLPDDGGLSGGGLPGDPDWPVLGFGPGDAGESMPPGVSLGMLTEHTVAGGGLAVISDYELIGLVAAARRQRNRSEWLELQTIREFTRRRWESGSVPVRDSSGRWLFKNSEAEQAADELAFHLADGRAQAEDRMELSVALRDRLPKLDALLAVGRLDERRLQAVADIAVGLTDEQARQLDEMLVPDAPGLPYTALRRRAAKLAISLSPEAEARRKKKATRRKARVEKFMERSGNYALAVREMPVEEILASEAHIRALAAYLRRHGVKLGQREAEVMVYLDLTQGRDPLERIAPDRRDHAHPGDSPRPARDGGSDGRGDSSGHESGPQDAGHDSAGQDRAGQDRAGQDSAGQDDEAWRDGPWDDYDEDDNSDGDGSDGDGGGGGPWPFAPPGPDRPGGRAPFPASINLLVPVGTAFGWSSMPGEAGRDIIDPRTLREMLQAASRHPATRWCVTLVGEDRTAVAHGCARGRHTWDPPPDEDGIDATAQAASRVCDPGQGPSAGQAAALAEFLARLKLSFEPIAKGTCDHRHAEPRYRPSKKLGHLTRARNATCPAPGCKASSWHSDMDHTTPWPDGPTDECNIGLPCRHHHRTKQAPGWKLQQPE
ncbi:MAG TPA: DUF222 domain-containing protein, partial [Trebonia sp.]